VWCVLPKMFSLFAASTSSCLVFSSTGTWLLSTNYCENTGPVAPLSKSNKAITLFFPLSICQQNLDRTMRLSLYLGGPVILCCFYRLSSTNVYLKGMMNTNKIRDDVGIFRLWNRGFIFNNISVARCCVKMFTIATSVISCTKLLLR
jgi:hypothetical protein